VLNVAFRLSKDSEFRNSDTEEYSCGSCVFACREVGGWGTREVGALSCYRYLKKKLTDEVQI
jgi:protein-arginine kinase activator protein McsA